MGWHHCGVTDKAFTLPCTGHLSQGDSKETSLCTNGGQNIQSRQGLHFCVKTCSEVTELGKAIYNRRNLSLLFGSFDQTLFKGGKNNSLWKRGARIVKQMRKTGITLCEPTQWETHSSCGCPHKIRPPETFAFCMSEHFGTFNFKKKNPPQQKSWENVILTNYKTAGEFGDTLIVKDTIKHPF